MNMGPLGFQHYISLKVEASDLTGLRHSFYSKLFDKTRKDYFTI